MSSTESTQVHEILHHIISFLEDLKPLPACGLSSRALLYAATQTTFRGLLIRTITCHDILRELSAQGLCSPTSTVFNEPSMDPHHQAVIKVTIFGSPLHVLAHLDAFSDLLSQHAFCDIEFREWWLSLAGRVGLNGIPVQAVETARIARLIHSFLQHRSILPLRREHTTIASESSDHPGWRFLFDLDVAYNNLLRLIVHGYLHVASGYVEELANFAELAVSERHPCLYDIKSAQLSRVVYNLHRFHAASSESRYHVSSGQTLLDWDTPAWMSAARHVSFIQDCATRALNSVRPIYTATWDAQAS
ncbi:hypothetical protein BC835DRAFT_1303191 [Cytidiella melzeri]|nr:hypothetical protein BC835DRAFT_1303191 [Cytidiella melzeri]